MKYAEALTTLETLLGSAHTGTMRQHVSDTEREALSMAIGLLRRAAFIESRGLALAPEPEPRVLSEPPEGGPPPSPVRKPRRKRKPADEPADEIDIPF